MLATRAGHPVPVSELIAGVWHGQPPAAALPWLHRHLAGLDLALAPGRPHRAARPALLASGRGYRLRLGLAGLDTAQLDRHIAQARQACTAGDLGRAVRLLDTALRLYRGVPLAGVPGPWAAAERLRVAELRLVLLEERTEMLLAMGRHDQVVPDLLGLTQAHPQRERFLSQLMVALYRAGRRADALAQFAQARQQRGLEPGPGLRRLRLQILTADTALMTVLPPGSGLPGGRRGGLSGLSREAAAANPQTAAAHPEAAAVHRQAGAAHREAAGAHRQAAGAHRERRTAVRRPAHPAAR